jgi:hypothetical protein
MRFDSYTAPESAPDSPEVSEIAALLARGILRLRSRIPPSLPAQESALGTSPKLALPGLDLPADPRLSVHSG